ncbi:MAG TPA: GDP-mannose 4,6-dehydratase [Candidatus Dormibacteraeota bacterium]|nr:GDP-mannose 4,6-dehydratase [Candidatus Dormibacteraeota bacterium]
MPHNEERRTALITGIGGQDGSYLAEHLLGQGYRVVGVRRGTAVPERIRHLLDRIELVDVDLLDEADIAAVLGAVRPGEVYNLAGHSFVPTSWDRPDLLGEVTGLAAPRLLEAIRTTDPTIRFYQASSSEIFGNARETPQTETTPLNPRNPYGAAKAFGHFSTVNAREGMGLFAVCGILYNHESPRRGLEFVSRKVSDGVARISLGLADSLQMGSLDAVRDWGFAGDYVRAMCLMLQQETPRDYIISSGVAHTVLDLVRTAFAHVGLDYERYVVIDPNFVRPAETFRLVGDSTRARTELGWRQDVSFEQLIGMMVDADLERHRGLRSAE